MFDISEIGAILCQINFDEDDYQEYLSENGLQNSMNVLKNYMREYCDYDVSYQDSEYFHDMGKYDTLTIEEISDNFGEKIAEAVLNDCMDGKEHDFEIQAYQEEIVDINNPQEVNKYAVKYLPHGEYYKGCRGFLLTDGNIIYTDSEHNQCSRIPGIRGTFQFIELGNIRLTKDGIDIAKYPTSKQLDKLIDILYNYQGQTFYLSLLNKKLGNKSRAYGDCDADEVINDIKNYFYGNLMENKNNKTMIKISENKLKKLISESIKNAINELYHLDSNLSPIGKKAYGIIDWLANEGVITYSDEFISDLVNNPNKIDFKDICENILREYRDGLTQEEIGRIKHYLSTGDDGELENEIILAVQEFEKNSHGYMNL